MTFRSSIRDVSYRLECGHTFESAYYRRGDYMENRKFGDYSHCPRGCGRQMIIKVITQQSSTPTNGNLSGIDADPSAFPVRLDLPTLTEVKHKKPNNPGGRRHPRNEDNRPWRIYDRKPKPISAKEQQVLDLRSMGFKWREIAAQIGTRSPSTAESIHHRALEKLEELNQAKE